MNKHRGDGHRNRTWPGRRESVASSDEGLRRLLIVLGPLLRRRARVTAPRHAFVSALRVHLLTSGLGALPGRTGRADSAPQRRSGASSPEVGASQRASRAIVGLALAVALLTLGVLGAVAGGQVGLALVLLNVMVLAVLIIALIAAHVGRP